MLAKTLREELALARSPQKLLACALSEFVQRHLNVRLSKSYYLYFHPLFEFSTRVTCSDPHSIHRLTRANTSFHQLSCAVGFAAGLSLHLQASYPSSTSKFFQLSP
ncbi:hypothetical protein Dimus_017129 [Dionaea muscipula]